MSKGAKAWQGPFDIEINLVWNKLTHSSIPEALNFLSKYPVTRIHLLPEKMYDFSRKEDSLFNLRHLHKVYTELRSWQREFKMNIVFPNFLKYELPCNQPLDMVFMLSNGELMACCSAIFHGHKHRFSLGNLMDFGVPFRNCGISHRCGNFVRRDSEPEITPSHVRTVHFGLLTNPICTEK